MDTVPISEDNFLKEKAVGAVTSVRSGHRTETDDAVARTTERPMKIT
ncbi:hypothetical protein HALLA_09790 [Halostagnicola larsenii XH-48]|uniref:Uncharacterized protein n=1 Tax=Halostagnicola larsenii XH-48 TaxID=797299 RepID=W0JQ66_9EURY|nr:hypothetical protein HALLA_09790 [Halostagnicola larsenii XH-48]